MSLERCSEQWPLVTPAVLVWLDILGVKRLLCDVEAGEAQAVAKLRRLDPLLALIKSDEWTAFRKECSIFSDTLLLTFPAADEAAERCLVTQLPRALGDLQMRFLVDGFLLRGALTKGRFCRTEHFSSSVLLPSLDEHEKHRAKVPRILVALDEECVTPATGTSAFHDEYERMHAAPHIPGIRRERHLRRDTDGYWFVDYLHSAMVFGDPQLLQQHKELVEQSARTHHCERRILNKYRWMARYHNGVSRSPRDDWPDWSKTHPSMMIDEALFPPDLPDPLG